MPIQLHEVSRKRKKHPQKFGYTKVPHSLRDQHRLLSHIRRQEKHIDAIQTGRSNQKEDATVDLKKNGTCTHKRKTPTDKSVRRTARSQHSKTWNKTNLHVPECNPFGTMQREIFEQHTSHVTFSR